jgi:hypothetical protein
VQGEKQDRVRALLHLYPDQPGLTGQVIHIRQKSSDTIPVLMTASTIEGEDANVIVVSFTPADETPPPRSSNRAWARSSPSANARSSASSAAGKTSRTIADHLSISDKAVETHHTRIMQKLVTHCVVDLVKFDMNNGLARLQ